MPEINGKVFKARIEKLTPYVEEHGLSWDWLRPFVDLRQELFELDIRFGQIGCEGGFNQLDAAGVLTHAAPGVDDVDRAVTDRAFLQWNADLRATGALRLEHPSRAAFERRTFYRLRRQQHFAPPGPSYYGGIVYLKGPGHIF